MDELKGKQVITRKRGHGPDYINLFVKHHKDKMREFARQRGIRNPIDVGLDKWGLERWRVLEEERASKEAREETRVQIEVLNEQVVALYASECLKTIFSLHDFKCNIIALLTDCILYMKGLDASSTMSQRWLKQGMRKRS